MGFWGDLWDAGKSFFRGVGKACKAVVSGVSTVVKTVATVAAKALKTVAVTAVKAAGSLLGGKVGALLSSVKSMLTGVLTPIFGPLAPLVSDFIINAATEVFCKLVSSTLEKPVTVDDAEGIVYKVTYEGRELALKWYYPHKLRHLEKFYKNIQKNIDKGAPSAEFLWPLELTEISNHSFGYLMELRPSNYKDFSQFLLAKAKFSSIQAMIHAALSIISSFRKLHNSGFSYQDLNDGNFFINPQTGDVLICDNDNVAEYGTNLGIAGKCRYMAPEVVVGKKKPDIHTDRFSLAVVLYLLLFLNHPLEGNATMRPCLTEELERKLYGEQPLFVWDKKDTSNRPVVGIHVNQIRLWPLFPQFIRDIFTQAFSQSVMIGEDIEHRVMEKKWQDTFVKLRSEVVDCPHCGKETFIDTVSKDCTCMNCNKPMSAYPILEVKKQKLRMVPNQTVYTCHTVADNDDYTSSTGTVMIKEKGSTVVGLRNDSSTVWRIFLPDGKVVDCKPGTTFALKKGIKIEFGHNCVGHIV